MTSHAIRVHAYGGPEALSWEEIELAPPGPGEVLLRQTAIGLNYIDVYHRSGLYPLPLPLIPGQEGAGIVEALGEGVTDFAVGDRVAYTDQKGAYAEMRTAYASRLVKLPDAIDDRTAAAMMLQGLTARYLLHDIYRVGSEDTILVHAAAGGVGLIMCQWAASLGATVIGTVSTDEKALLAASHGCHHPIVTTREDFVERVAEITGGAKLPVVYDSIGKDSFTRSLDCLRSRGLAVTFGQSSGKIPPFDLGILSAKGSLMVTRPTLVDFIATRAALTAATDDLFQRVASGAIRIAVNQAFPLAEAAAAHRALEARQTTGSTVLTV